MDNFFGMFPEEWGFMVISGLLLMVVAFITVVIVRRVRQARAQRRARAEASAARSRKWAAERAARYASPEYIATLKPATPRVVNSVPVVREKRRFSESSPFYFYRFDGGKLYGTRFSRSSWF